MVILVLEPGNPWQWPLSSSVLVQKCLGRTERARNALDLQKTLNSVKASAGLEGQRLG